MGARSAIETWRAWKGKRRIAALTAYDYPTGAMAWASGSPLVLVGDSLGMVALGFESTQPVTLDMMRHHVAAVARAPGEGMLVADLPNGTYGRPEEAVASSRALIEAGATAVKAEGGRSIAESVAAIRAEGIDYLGHIGLLPQSVAHPSGYKVVGKTPEEREAVIADARAVQDQGAFAVVLELVEPKLAQEITETLAIPTIGIGSGPYCDGEILVTSDLLHLGPKTPPKHARPPVNYHALMTDTLRDWVRDVEERV